MTLQQIAKFINKSCSYVFKICKDLRSPKTILQKEIEQEIMISSKNLFKTEVLSKYKFTSQQKLFLTDSKTLKEQAGRSLVERVM